MSKNVKTFTLQKTNRWKSFIVFLSLFVFITLSSNAYAQGSHSITGTVTGDNEGLIGASILEKGTTNGTVTDFDGNFSLTVKENAVLVITYLGFKEKSVTVGKASKLDIVMEKDANVLEEFVAIGYGVQQKKLITGATVQVKGDDISKLNTVSAIGALQSQTPGVNIVKTSGKPGEGFKVTIRGLGTIHNSNPLYIIDGVPNDADGFNRLNPSDIETVDVLKDAASTAIYGARAANGVILITTKQGKKGRTNIQYDGYFGWQNIAKKPKLLNAQQYIDIMKEVNPAYNDEYFSGYDNNGNKRVPMWDKIQSGEFTGTNWLDEMTNKNAPQQSHTVNVTGGNDTSIFSIGLSYTSQKPLIGLKTDEMNSKYERYTVRVNTEHNLAKAKDFTILQFGQTLTMGYVNKNGLGMGVGSVYWSDVRNALSTSPLFPAYKDNGEFEWPVLLDPEETNPLNEIYSLRTFVNSKNYTARGSFYFVLQPIKDLKIKTNFGYAYNGWSSREYIPKYQLNERVYSKNDKTSQGSGNGLQWSWDNTISYDFKIGEHHKFTTLAGASVEKWGLGEDVNGSNINSKFSDFDHAYLYNTLEPLASGTATLSGSPWTEGSLASFFARANYDYAGKYMATVVMRTDGSSNFSKGNRWGFFPSISAGWNIAEEDFMKNTRDYLDQLKFRISWGENGNCNIPAFRYLASFATGNSSNAAWYYFGDNKGLPTIGSYADIMKNEGLKWETSRQLNIGIDSRFLNSRLGFSFDWYDKRTIDWLFASRSLGIWGSSSGPYVNAGDVKNTGFEISADWNDNIGDFKYGIRANMAYNKNKVIKLYQDKPIDGGADVLGHGVQSFGRVEIDKPIGYFYGYKTDGIFQNQEEIDSYIDPTTGTPIMPNAKPGDVRFVDRNGNGIIDDEDRTEIGNPHPDLTYGITINLEYKGFDFSVTGYGVAGNQIAKSYRNYIDKTFDNYTTDILNRWHGEGTSNRLPSVSSDASPINWQYVSDLYIENGDYFRITNLSLGYDLKRIFKSLPLSQIRIYGAVNNLCTFTKYSGMDPEVGYNGGLSWLSGVDVGYYPGARSYMIGFSIKY